MSPGRYDTARYLLSRIAQDAEYILGFLGDHPIDRDTAEDDSEILEMRLAAVEAAGRLVEVQAAVSPRRIRLFVQEVDEPDDNGG